MPKTVKNSQNDRALQFFDEVGESSYKCKLCGGIKRAPPKRICNLVAHLSTVHEKEYKLHIKPDCKDESYFAVKRLKKLQSFAQIVTVDGRSFQNLKDSGFQKCIEENLKELADAGYEIKFSNNFEELKPQRVHRQCFGKNT